MELGSVTVDEANAVVTPAELQGVDRNEFSGDVATVNLLRLLQTMDLDGDPSNGIMLPDEQALVDAGLKNGLSGIELGDPSFDSQIAASLADFKAGFDTSEELVSAEQASEHFEATLRLIAIPDSIIVLDGTDQWHWDAYVGDFGEWGSRIIFNQDGTGELIEYAGCPDSGGASWKGTYERAREVCSNKQARNIQWGIQGNTIKMDAGSFTDTCTVISGNKNHFTASCRVFVGGGRYASETQYFVRADVNGFYQELLVGDHLEFNESGTHQTDDNTAFEIGDGAGTYKVGGESVENYMWSIGSNIEDWILDVEGEGVLPPIKFRNYVAGAHEIGSTEDNSNTVLIPDYRGWRGGESSIGRYSLSDAGSGYLLSEDAPDGFIYDQALLCEPGLTERREICLDEAFTGETYSQVCSPIHSIPTADGLGVYWMNCRPELFSDVGEGQSFQIWRRDQ
jgi:hypothetical protein